MESSGSGETNALINLTYHRLYTDKIYLCAKDSYEAKYHFLINKRKGVGLEECNNSKAFMDHLDDMDGIYENIKEYNPERQHKLLITFGNMTTDILRNKKLNLIAAALFIRG